jgi:hypothetical protein
MSEHCSPVNIPYWEKDMCGAVNESRASRDSISMKWASTSLDLFTKDQRWKNNGKYSCGCKSDLSSGAGFVGSNRFNRPITTNAPSEYDVLKNGKASSKIAGISCGSKYSWAKVHSLVRVRMFRLTLGGCEPPDSDGRTKSLSSRNKGRQSNVRSLPGRR